MTADPTPIPAAPTPYTHKQAAAILGHNAVTSYPDEAVIPAQLAQVAAAALTPDSTSLPPAPRRYPRLTLRPWTDPNDEVA